MSVHKKSKSINEMLYLTVHNKITCHTYQLYAGAFYKNQQVDIVKSMAYWWSMFTHPQKKSVTLRYAVLHNDD